MKIVAPRRWRPAGLLCVGVLLGALDGALAQAPAPVDPWPDLARDLFQGRAIANDGSVVLEAPVRAEDAAIVPMTLRLKAAGLRRATLVVDQNPMPMAAAFTFGETAGVTFISTRARVNSYTNVHAVGETGDGALHAQVKFVKAAGGCSAPAVKNMDEAASHLGQMKYREFKSGESGHREAQIMIRHPNNSGMQMDQLTHLYIPAHYIDKVVVRQGDTLIFSMEGGISLSEDPNFRFSYAPNGARTISVEAHDTKGNVFKQEWSIGEAS
jgi:sulfur-oxidizing protein SoxY